MPTYTLTHVPDERLLADLAALVAADRQTTAMLLAHIAEVDARELFAPAACTSMHVYCMRVLHLSEDAAFKRIRAARAGRRFPQVFDAIADGRLHLSGVVLLAPHLTDQNVDALIAEATHKSKCEIEMLLARLAPRPDVPATITPIVPSTEPSSQFPLAPGPVAPPSQDAPPPRVTPLAPERFALQLTISQATRDKLERAQALLRHRNPSGDLAVVLDRALDALLANLEREKFGATSRPRAKGARPDSADPRHVSNEVLRAVHARDGEQCTFVSESGERCCERGFLEIDHRNPVALGGQPTVDNLRLLCRTHNQYEAKRILGADAVRAGRAQKDAMERTRGGVSTVSENCDAMRDELTLALRRLGFRADEVHRAIDSLSTSRSDGSLITLEAQLRAALAVLTRSRGSRCSEGLFDEAALGWRCSEGVFEAAAVDGA